MTNLINETSIAQHIPGPWRPEESDSFPFFPHADEDDSLNELFDEAMEADRMPGYTLPSWND